jgi:D-lactate dehydrogenase
MSLFARIDDAGEVQLLNHLGVRFGNDPETILDTLERDAFTEAEIEYDSNRVASDRDYAQDVRDIDADTPGRYNADPKRLFEASGSAGKVMIFAVRLDTFPKEEETKVFYIGTNDPAELTKIRRYMLRHFNNLQIAGEYLHRVAFDIAQKYGKDTFLAIQYLGADWLPTLFAIKGRFDAFAGRRLSLFPRDLSDKIMQAISRIFPPRLPGRMLEYRDKYEHHLMLKMAGTGIGDARRFLQSTFPTAQGDFFECTADEARQGLPAPLCGRRRRDPLPRDPPPRGGGYRRARRGAEAERPGLGRNPAGRPREADNPQALLRALFLHQDYIISKGHDTVELEHRMWKLLDARGAQYPAEHNVGHLYEAKPALLDHYKSLDPCNCFNPGIGRTAKNVRWKLPRQINGQNYEK